MADDPTTTPPAEPDPQPAQFDWTVPLPADLPPEFQSLAGKTLKDLAEAHSNMRRQVSDMGARLKDSEAKLAQTNTPPPPPPAPTPPPEPSADDRVRVLELQQKYFRDGSLQQSEVDELKSAFGDLDEGVLLDFFEWQRTKRDNFFQKAEREYSEHGVNMGELERWLESGQSPFSQAAINGFLELAAKMDDTSWVGTAWNAYKKYLENGGKPMGDNSFRQPGPPPRSGRAPTDASTPPLTGEEFIRQQGELMRKIQRREATHADLQDLIARRERAIQQGI